MVETLLKCISLAFFVLAADVWGQDRAGADTEAEQARWEKQFWVSLESSSHAQLRTMAALRLKRADDPTAKELGKDLIREVLRAPQADPASLWLLASDCPWGEPAEWCELGGVHEQLEAADPGNAAVILLRFSQLRPVDRTLLDSDSNRQVMLNAAQADYFDAYWGRGADKLHAAALNYASANPAPPFPEAEGLPSPDEWSPAAYASMLATGPIAAHPLPGFSNLFEWCQIQAENRHAGGIETCKNLALILRNKGYSLLARSVGHGIETLLLRVVDPENPEIQMWQARKNLLSVMQLCFMPEWQRNPIWTSEPKIMNWARNLSERGEWEGNRLTAFQEYRESPEDFTVNPAECDRLKDLDDEALNKFMDGRQATEVWNSMSSKSGDMK